MSSQAENFVFNKPIRLLYTNALIGPVAFRNDDGTQGSPRFNMQGLIPPDHPQLGAFQQLVLKVARNDLPAHVDAAGQWTHEGLKLPLKNGDRLIAESVAKARAKGKEPPDRSFYAGQMVLLAQKPEKSRAGAVLNPPGLVVLQNGKMVEYADAQRPLAKDFFYSGVMASVSVQLKGFTGFGGGVTCYLDRVLSLNTGDRIPVGRDDESTFGSADSYSEYVGHVSVESVIPRELSW